MVSTGAGAATGDLQPLPGVAACNAANPVFAGACTLASPIGSGSLSASVPPEIKQVWFAPEVMMAGEMVSVALPDTSTAASAVTTNCC